MKVLVTGASGFVGRNLVPFLQNNQIDVVCLDKTKPDPAWDSHSNCITYPLGSFGSSSEFCAKYLNDVSVVIHCAAESHVDRSISGPVPFVDHNIRGTLELFEICKNMPQLERIILFSTDEVGACLKEGTFYETNNFNCGSVYSASKGAQELLAQAYIKTYNLPIITTRCVNIFGPHQWDEKFIPTICRKTLKGEKVPIYGSGMQQRQWVHVDHVCDFVNHVVVSSFIPPNTVLHITGTAEVYNITLARMIVGMLGGTPDQVEHVADRLGHDERYSLGRGRVTEDFACPEYDVTKFDTDLLSTVLHYRKRYM